MGRAPVILVPPSEGKVLGGGGAPWTPGRGVLPELDAARAAVLAAVGGGVDGEPTMPAIERYSGVLYKELDWASLPSSARRRGRSSLLIVSGLWGAVGVADPIPYYKLKMSASVPGIGRLSTWWRPRLTVAFAAHLRDRVVWDLLPQEHAAAWDPGAIQCRRRHRVRVVDADGRTVGHWNKLVKGALVRRLLLGGLDDPAALDGWVHDSGYGVEVVT
jgi:cytoplasmic iron level regulating protein YaaA (DUF328/UPF0246 family)